MQQPSSDLGLPASLTPLAVGQALGQHQGQALVLRRAALDAMAAVTQAKARIGRLAHGPVREGALKAVAQDEAAACKLHEHWAALHAKNQASAAVLRLGPKQREVEDIVEGPQP
jgi:hypothetical protein